MRTVGLLAFFIVVFGPIAALAVDAAGLFASGGPWPALTARHGALLARTFVLAAGVAAGASAVGLVAAGALWSRRAGVLGRARWLALALVIVPPHIHALAWTAAVSAAADLLGGAGAGVRLDGWVGAWWVEVMAYLPIAVGLSLVGLASVDPDMLDAARVLGSDARAWMRVALPTAAPAVAAAASVIFLLALTDYGVPSLFQVNVFPLELFVHYSGGGRPGGALVLALPLLALGVAAVLVLQAALCETVTRPLWGARAAGLALALPAWWRVLGGAALVAVAAQVLVPVVVLVTDSVRYGDAASAVASAWPDILTTFAVAGLAAVLCLPMAVAAARGLASRGARGAAWWFLVAAPLAVPAPLVGIGLVSLWNRPPVDGVYGTAAMPVLASLARFTTLAAIVVAAQERRIDPLLFDAGRVFQRGRLRAWVQVRLPMLAPGLLAAALGVAALSAGELGATLIVAPPGTSTLAMRIYSYLHYGALENAAGLCLVMTAASAAAVAAGLAGFRVWSRLMPGPGRTGR